MNVVEAPSESETETSTVIEKLACASPNGSFEMMEYSAVLRVINGRGDASEVTWKVKKYERGYVPETDVQSSAEILKSVAAAYP